MTQGDGGQLRIGNAERTSAMKALDAHLDAGRLGVEEYADRSAKAANATVATELTELFTDLPAPHPDLGAAGPAVDLVKPPQAAPAGAGTGGAVAERAGGMLETWGGRVVAVTPIVALVLFLIFHQWWFFLLIPAVGALVYGGHGGHGERRRDERRALRDDRWDRRHGGH